jgi:hypothetical protein
VHKKICSLHAHCHYAARLWTIHIILDSILGAYRKLLGRKTRMPWRRWTSVQSRNLVTDRRSNI